MVKSEVGGQGTWILFSVLNSVINGHSKDQQNQLLNRREDTPNEGGTILHLVLCEDTTGKPPNEDGLYMVRSASPSLSYQLAH